MLEYRIITPTDVLFLRSNCLFGGAGEHGGAEMPPWPSVFAGAVASRILADHDCISKVTGRPKEANRILAEAAGEDFSCAFLGLGYGGQVFLPLPADLMAEQPQKDVPPVLRRLRPRTVPAGLACSSTLPMVPVLEAAKRVKPLTDRWLDLNGWRCHLRGEIPTEEHLVAASDLWQLDHRLGIARDEGSRTAAESRIYTSEAVALARGVSFVVGFSGKNIPEDGLLRLGGDGRGAFVEPAADRYASQPEPGQPEAGWPGFRMILTSPGVFPDGWLPPGCEEEEGRIVFIRGSLRARLHAAILGRPGVISGWDMANHCPKPACKVAPIGSVYWFAVEEGDTAELEVLWRRSLYAQQTNLDDEYRIARQREGFGRVWFGIWQPE